MSEVKKWKTEELELLNRLVGAAFCQELNQRRKAIDPADVAAVYDLSFWAHYELVTIHPWADGNGRTCRLLMNLLQWEFDVLPTKVLKEDKAEYIQALIDTRESDDLNISTQMAASLGINRSAVSKHLKKLQADGIIRRVGPDKGGHWEVIKWIKEPSRDPPLFITESKFDWTKYYTKSRMLNPFILHEIKGKGKFFIYNFQVKS